MAKPVLLAVLAHPDDETFGMGGTLAYYASQGVDVHLVCATRGEVGDASAEHMQGYDSVAEMRESELRCAAGILGLKSVEFLGYRDSSMPGTPDNSHSNALFAQPIEKVARDVVSHIRRLKPQVVITFDPIGGYRHPDHIAIQRATVLAFELAGKKEMDESVLPAFLPQRLYFHIFPHGMVHFAVKVLPLFGKDPRHFGKNRDIDLASIAIEDFPVHAVIDYRSSAISRDKAASCHASQGGGQMSKGVMGWVMHMFAGKDRYMRAFPAVQPDEHREKDLFAGVILSEI